MAVLIINGYIGLFGTGFMQVLYLGRAPRTKETLLYFREECRVTRHSRVFRGLTGSQRTPGFWGVTGGGYVFRRYSRDPFFQCLSFFFFFTICF